MIERKKKNEETDEADGIRGNAVKPAGDNEEGQGTAREGARRQGDKTPFPRGEARTQREKRGQNLVTTRLRETESAAFHRSETAEA